MAVPSILARRAIHWTLWVQAWVLEANTHEGIGSQPRGWSQRTSREEAIAGHAYNHRGWKPGVSLLHQRGERNVERRKRKVFQGRSDSENPATTLCPFSGAFERSQNEGLLKRSTTLEARNTDFWKIATLRRTESGRTSRLGRCATIAYHDLTSGSLWMLRVSSQHSSDNGASTICVQRLNRIQESIAFDGNTDFAGMEAVHPRL